MAEAMINHRRGEQWQAASAGTRPAAQVHPAAIAALAEIGIPVEDARPKSIDSFRGQAFDLIITVCDDAAENCPVWPEQGRRAHIGFPDPAAAVGSEADVLAAFRMVRDEIERRVLQYLDSL